MAELAVRTSQSTPARRPDTEPPPAYTAVDWQLSASTLARIQDAPAENTLRAYRRWLARWNEWCEATGRVALPSTPHTLAEWISHLCDLNTGMPSLRTAVAAVRFLHATQGYDGEPAGKLAIMVRKSHARDRAKIGNRVRKATPIMADALGLMLDTCDGVSLRGLRDRLVLVLGWGAMLRRSELAALMLRDVTPTADGLDVFVAMSKTDQQAAGHTVHVPDELLGGLNPVPVWRAYVNALTAHGETSGRLIRSIGKGGRVGSAITGHGVNEIVREAAERAKLGGAQGYTAHSLRAGAASAAHKAGWPVSSIAEHGRWAPNSPVVLGYIRAVDRRKENPMRAKRSE